MIPLLSGFSFIQIYDLKTFANTYHESDVTGKVGHTESRLILTVLLSLLGGDDVGQLFSRGI